MEDLHITNDPAVQPQSDKKSEATISTTELKALVLQDQDTEDITSTAELETPVLPKHDEVTQDENKDFENNSTYEDDWGKIDESDADEDADDVLLVDDFQNNALTGTALTREIFPPYKTVFKLNGVQYTVDLSSHDIAKTKSSLTFRMPGSQRSALVLRITFPRNTSKAHNPGGIRTHGLFVYIPAPAIKKLEYKTLDRDQEQPHTFSTGEGFSDFNNTPYPLAIMDVSATGAFVQAGSLPQLTNDDLMAKAKRLVDTIRAGEIDISFLIRTRHDLTQNDFNEFSHRRTGELAKDPSLAWIQDSPNAQTFTMGNLVDMFERPQIPAQRAETVFYDKLAYLVPMVYGAVYEDEYQQLLSHEFCAATYTMTLIEVPNARKIPDANVDVHQDPVEIQQPLQSLQSAACAYIGFVDYSNLALVRPTVGTRLKVTLDLASAAANVPINDNVDGAQEETPQQDKATATNNESGGSSEENKENEENEENEENSGSISDGYDPLAELGNEDMADAFDEDADNLDEDAINIWSATVIENTPITPPGHITIMLERRRQLGWTGPPHTRPFVSVKLTVVNLATATSIPELQTLLKDGPTMQVMLSMVYSRQGLKDMVRCADALWRRTDAQKERICKALLGQNPDNSPLARLNLHKLRGPRRFSALLNQAQMSYYNSLSDVPEISMVHGGYGTGKTTLCIAVTAEIATAPAKQQILYLVETNKAVDEVALRFEEIFANAKMDVPLLRLHSLPGEKRNVYPHFRTMPPSQDRFMAVTDEVVAEVSFMVYLNKMGNDYQEACRRGDPRRVCTHLTLSSAMCKILETSERPEWVKLKGMLQDYGQDGFFNTDAETRTMIKLALNDLMAFTLQRQRVIVCTLSAAAKVNLAENFDPIVVVLDEAARVTELKTLIPFGLYRPKMFLLAGDHNQQLPYCESYGRENDKENPYLNPFGAQQLLSVFERLIRNGTEHTLLDLQHRCLGDIQQWVSDTFYHGRVREAARVPADLTVVESIRDFCSNMLGTATRTNRYARNITNSHACKETGGMSLINEGEVQSIVADLELMAANPLFRTKRIGILSFYKAQLALLKLKCDTLGLAANFVDLSTHTVASAQGTEYDVVLLSLVATSRVAFINEPHSLVVALTRARYLLGIYTNWSILTDIKKPNANNMFIKSLLDDLSAKGHVVETEFICQAVLCFNCGQAGHARDNCPNPKAEQCRRCIDNGDQVRKWGHTASACTLYARAISCARCREHDHPDAGTHASKDCPHFPRSAATIKCRECNQMGHLRRNCPLVVCGNCKETGHTIVACPEPVLCTKCRLPGHIARECTTVLTRAHLASVRVIQPANNIRRQFQDIATATDQAQGCGEVECDNGTGGDANWGEDNGGAVIDGGSGW